MNEAFATGAGIPRLERALDIFLKKALLVA